MCHNSSMRTYAGKANAVVVGAVEIHSDSWRRLIISGDLVRSVSSNVEVGCRIVEQKTLRIYTTTPVSNR